MKFENKFIRQLLSIRHAAMENILVMNGLEVDASIDEKESIFLSLASGKLGRE